VQEENELKMLKVLSNYEALDIRTSVLPWTPKEGEEKKARQEPKEKTRFTFHFTEQEAALKCFADLQDPSKLP
jgi:hypothetical protein